MALLAPLTPHAKAPRPHQHLFLGLQGNMNSFLLAFKPAVCQATNFPKPSKSPFDTLTPQAKAPRPHQQLFLGLQGDINSFKPSKTLPRLFWHPWPRRPRHQGHMNSFFLAFKATSIACYWRSSLPCPKASMPFYWRSSLVCEASNFPKPSQQLFLRLQGDINTFFLAFKPPVSQASNLPKPSKSSFGTPHPAGQGTKATSIAFPWPSTRHQ